MIELTIPARPVAKGRPRVTRRGFAYTPKKTLDAERSIAIYARVAMKANDQHRPLEGPLVVKMIFVLKPPGSWSKKKKDLAIRQEILPAIKPDLDNYCKLILDSLNGVCYKTDSQIVKLEAQKQYGYNDAIHIIIIEI